MQKVSQKKKEKTKENMFKQKITINMKKNIQDMKGLAQNTKEWKKCVTETKNIKPHT